MYELTDRRLIVCDLLTEGDMLPPKIILIHKIWQLFNKYALLTTRRITKPKAPWYTKIIKMMCREVIGYLVGIHRRKKIEICTEPCITYVISAIRQEKNILIHAFTQHKLVETRGGP